MRKVAFESASKPWLLVSIPHTSYIPGRQPSYSTVFTHTVRTLIAICSIQSISLLITIGSICKIGCCTRTCIIHTIITRVLFLTLLKELIGVERQLTILVLHTNTIEECAFTLNTHSLNSSQCIDIMNLIECCAIVCLQTEILTNHTVVCTLIQTTFWQYANRQFVWWVWVIIQIFIFVTNNLITHSTISHSLIRIILDMMLLWCLDIANST